MTEEPESLRAEIKRRREAIGVGPVELAQRAGMGRNYVTQVESGQTNPRAANVRLLRHALDALEQQKAPRKPDTDERLTIVTVTHPGEEPFHISVKGPLGPRLEGQVLDILRSLRERG